jgi:hypothetical protein
MDAAWRTALWRQVGAAIDTLDNALVACPAALWTRRLWPNPPAPHFPPQFAEFWYVAFHGLVWLDLYLSGVPEEEFAPSAPFAQGVLDSREAVPERPYAKDELRAYLAATRRKCPRHASRADGRAGPPARRVPLVRGAADQLPGAAPLQHAPGPGARGPAEPVPRTARHPGRGPRHGPASEGDPGSQGDSRTVISGSTAAHNSSLTNRLTMPPRGHGTARAPVPQAFQLVT